MDEPLKAELAPATEMQPDPASLQSELQNQSTPEHELTPTALTEMSDTVFYDHMYTKYGGYRTAYYSIRRSAQRRNEQEADAKRQEAVAKRLRELDPESLPFPPFVPFPPDLWNEPLRGGSGSYFLFIFGFGLTLS